MKRLCLVPALLVLLGTAESRSAEDDSVLRIAPCRIEVILNYTRVCLDGVWVLSDGILGKNALYRFVRERGYLVLVPILDEAARTRLRGQLDSRILEIESLDSALSIQGMLVDNGLVFDQRNALVTWHETTQIRLAWDGKAFFGQAESISGRSAAPRRPQSVSLRKYTGSVLPREESSPGQEDF